jgi:hypothetical protein
MSSLLQQIKSLDANKQNTLTSADTLSLDTLTTLDANVLGNATVGGDLLVKGIELDAKITNATSGKQGTLTAGDNITIDENNVISSSGGGGGTLPEDATFTSINTSTLTTGTSFFTDKMDITNSPAETTDTAINIVSQLILKGNTFDTIILRRISGDKTLNIRETQLWINDINIFINNTQPSQNKDNLSLGDTVEFFIQNSDGSFSTRNALQTYFASNAVNNSIGDNLDTHSESADNASLYIPLTSTFDLADIQSFVLYNRTFSDTGNRSIGLQLQVYNRVDDPTLSTPLAISNTITEAQPVYRFDFPEISTYTDFVSVDSIDFITSNALISTDITFEEGSGPEYGVAIKIVDGRIETNQEISSKNVVVADTTPTLDNELTSKSYVDALIANLQAQIDAMATT